MKEDNIEQFFSGHKQKITDEGFSNRLFATLDCLPEPKPRVDKSRFVTAIFAAFGFVLFVLLGGYSIFIDGLSSMGVVFVNYKLVTPEIVIAILFTFYALFALGRFAIEDN